MNSRQNLADTMHGRPPLTQLQPGRVPPFTRVDAALLVLLALLVALYFWRILTPNPFDRAQFPVGDFTDQFYAFRLYEARALAQGHIPIWSENFNSGHPFLADIQSAVFYPIALVNTLVHVWAFNSFSLFALELEALFHFYLAAAFTYLFARRVIKNRVGAFTSAIVFGFGGYLTSYPSLQLAILETAAWLPLALYFLHRATEDQTPTTNDQPQTTDKQRLRWLVCAGLILGVAALAGHPQTFLFVVAVSVIYFAWRKRSVLRPPSSDLLHPSSVVVQIASVLLIALGIAAIQLVPAIEYQQLSTREALSFADAAKGFPTLDILQFILPGYASAFASPLYVGILPLWLAIFALLRRRSERIFWGLVALGALLLSFGFYVFAYVLFYLFVPGASLFRQQERLAFVVSFALAMLAGYGITDLLNTVALRRAKKLFPILPAGAVLMLTLVVAFFVAGVENPQGRLAFLGDRAGLMLLLLGLTSLLLGLYLRKWIRVVWLVPLAILLILFDLWSVSEPANKGLVQERFPENELVNAVTKESGLFRVTADENLMPGHFGIVYDLQDIGGISPLRLARYDEFSRLPELVRWRMLNVTYHFTRQEAAAGQTPVAGGADGRVLALSGAMPRTWFVGEAVVQPDDAAALQTIASPGFVPAAQAVVATSPPFPPSPGAVDNAAEVTAYAPEAMTIQLRAPVDGLVVVSENFYPGWQATVDGQAVGILRANVTLRGIPVRAGARELKLWYDPLSLKIGAILSGVTLLSCLGALIFLTRRERRT